MRKLICRILAAALIAAMLLSGCGKGKTSSDSTEKTSPSTKKSSEATKDSGSSSSTPRNTQAVIKTLSSCKPGEVISFGEWTQNKKNKAEPIEWTVICQGVGKALIVSNQILIYSAFQEPAEGEDRRWTTGIWTESTLRTYLNGEFYEKAFSKDEKDIICETHHVLEYTYDYKPATAESDDKVFLLSYEEAYKYVCPIDKLIYGRPTALIQKEDPYMSEISGVDGIKSAMTWWLRDVGDNIGKAAAVFGYDDKPDDYGDDVGYKEGVRPALWVCWDEELMTAYAKGEAEPPADAELDAMLKNAKTGDELILGCCDIDRYAHNGYEKLSWIVLDETEDAILVIAKQRYWSSSYVKRDSGIETLTWAESDLRTYINSEDFLDGIFTPQEKAKILTTHLSTKGDEDWNRSGGAETDDRLFLPDYDDLEKYSVIQKTASFWLRSPSFVNLYMGSINDSCSISSKDGEDYYGVRPMMWLSR